MLACIATGSGLIVLVWLTDGIDAVATGAIVAVFLFAELTWEHTHHWRRTAVEPIDSPSN